MNHRLCPGSSDSLPARYVGNYEIQEIRRREVAREASNRWPLLAAVDEHLWSTHIRETAFDRVNSRMPADDPADAPAPFPRAVHSGGGGWKGRR